MRDLSQTNIQTHSKSQVTALAINIGLASAILGLGLIYVFSVSAMATTNYRIKKLSYELSDLEAQHKKLELQNSTLQSVSTIQQETALLNFVPASSVTYIKDDNFALR